MSEIKCDLCWSDPYEDGQRLMPLSAVEQSPQFLYFVELQERLRLLRDEVYSNAHHTGGIYDAIRLAHAKAEAVIAPYLRKYAP